MIAFIIGALIGSFLNVIIIRTPKNLSIITPRSHCINCKTNIPFYLNIPIVSYIYLRGKCHNCKKNISIQYPLVELLCATILMIYYSNTSINETALIFFVSCIFIIIGFIDLKYLLIHTYLIALLYIGLIIKIVLFNSNFLESLIGGVGVGCYLALCSLVIAIKKRTLSVIGMGDILLAIFIGSWFGIIGGIECLFISSIMGISYILINNKNEVKRIPFGLCMSMSFLFILILKIYGYNLIVI